MGSKRKRQTKFEVLDSTRNVPTQSTGTSRHTTFTRNATGRLGEHNENLEHELSPEDIAVLQEHAEFSLPAQTYLDFERYVQDSLDDSPVTENASTVQQRQSKPRIDPNVNWLPFRDEQLDEMLRHDGRADHAAICQHCDRQGLAQFKCQDCFGPTVFCRECVVSEHQRLPLHRIQEWTEMHWVRTSLAELGLTIQVGHNGDRCNLPKFIERPLTVIHVNGIHHIKASFCDCLRVAGGYLYGTQLMRCGWYPATMSLPRTAFSFEVLNHFHHLTLQGKTTAWDFYNALLHETDNTGLNQPPARYNEFVRAMRWWRHLKMLKRAGRGHDPEGPSATKAGQLAVECPACPQPAPSRIANLPEWWQSVPLAISWLYTLYLAMDANFRLKLRDRGIKNDPELGPGWAYFVNEPEYQKVMTTFGDQVEPNTCDSGLQAVDHANTRYAGKNIANGVGNIVCARHTLVRKSGAVDLKKGEKYCSMDYALLSTLVGYMILMLVLSYDIACQWSKNFLSRIPLFPELMQHNMENIHFTTVIPKFHIYAHGQGCQSIWSLNYNRWMGRTDGEGVEREWSHINPVALSTRLMGPGGRHDTLDDHWGAWNWRKVVGIGRHFDSKLREALAMSRKHRAAFNAVNSTFSNATSSQWLDMTHAWEADHSQPNPFEETKIETTQDDVQKALLAEEKAEQLCRNDVPIHQTTASKFLSMGLELEHQQRVVKARAKNVRLGRGLYEEGKLEHQRAALYDRIRTWRSLQTLYQPGVTQLRQTQATRTDGLPDSDESEKSETVCLWLPSRMPSTLWETGCVAGLLQKETQLRVAEATDALAAMRRQLRIMTGVFNYKKTHVSGSGQHANTRARTLMAQITQKTTLFAERYRAARAALMRLDPTGDWSKTLLPLLVADVRGPQHQEEPSEGRRELSWIWTTGSSSSTRVAVDGDEFELDECLRVEWAKSHARSQRWGEEVALLREEMRRVIASLHSESEWWGSQALRRDAARDDIADGLRAYARRQSELRRRLAESFASRWRPLLVDAGLSIEWAPHYEAYAVAHPPPPRRLARHVKRKPATQIEPLSEDSDSDEDDEDGANSSSDDDISPYR